MHTPMPRQVLGREAPPSNRWPLAAGIAAALLLLSGIGALVYLLADDVETAEVVALVSLLGFVLISGLSLLSITRRMARAEHNEEQRRELEARVAERTADLEASRL